MNRLNTLKYKIKYRIRKSKKNTFLIGDFLDLSDMDQVLRALRNLIKENELIRVGKGIYTKARKSLISNDYVPVDNLRNIAINALTAKGIKIFKTKAEIDYNNGVSMQIPNTFVIGVGKRISKKISFKNAVIKYEKVI